MDPKHPNPEDDYFAREDLLKLRKIAEEKRNQLAQKERDELKQLHWMRCAKCGSELQEILFHGVTVDKCFVCGGVFLDNGELEKLAGKESSFFQSVFSLFKTK